MTEQLGPVHSIRALRGTQREYETTLIVRRTLSKTGIGELISKISSICESKGGRLQAVENWGLRTLAYAIVKQKQGVYIYTRFLGGSEIVPELERNFRINEDVIRYLSVRLDEDVDPTARPSEIDDEQLEAVTDSGLDPVEEARLKAEAEAVARAEAEAVARAEAEAAAAVARAEAEAAAAVAAAAAAAAAPAPEPEPEPAAEPAPAEEPKTEGEN